MIGNGLAVQARWAIEIARATSGRCECWAMMPTIGGMQEVLERGALPAASTRDTAFRRFSIDGTRGWRPMAEQGHQITQEEYRRVGRVLRAWFRSAGVRRDSLDDLVQETFLHAQKGLNEGSFGSHSRLDTWIVAIGQRRLLKHRRRLQAAKRSGLELPLELSRESAAWNDQRTESSDPLASLYCKEVVGSLKRLPENLLQPLVLYADGLGYRETAVVLGISVELVKSRLHEARSRLRRLHRRSRSSVP